MIAENPPSDEAEEVDTSPALDLETIASAASEMEAMGIKNLLESNGIAAVLVGDSVLPNFPFEVRVAHDQVDRARLLIADAEAKRAGRRRRSRTRFGIRIARLER